MTDSVNNDVLDRMKNQWSDTKKEKFADYIIENVSLDKMYKKAQEIFEKLKNIFFEKLEYLI